MKGYADERRDLVTSSAAETQEIAAKVADLLKPGDVVLLRGDLGTGKTTFVRGACRQLGVTEPVTSPTFNIGQVYEGRDEDGRPLFISHLDLYRLVDLEDEDPGLIEDYMDPDRIVFMEWPDVAAGPLAERASWEIVMEHVGRDRRRLRIV